MHATVYVYLHVECHVPVRPSDRPVVEVLDDVVDVPLPPPPRPQGHGRVQGPLSRARLSVQDELVGELFVRHLCMYSEFELSLSC